MPGVAEDEAVTAQQGPQEERPGATGGQEESKKWKFVQKNLQKISGDPLNPKQSGWDSVPLMHVPRIIAAISNPPPPPPRPSGSGAATSDGAPSEGSPTTRPQTVIRFKRIVHQSGMAMQMINRVNDTLRAARESAAKNPAPPQQAAEAQSSPLQQRLSDNGVRDASPQPSPWRQQRPLQQSEGSDASPVKKIGNKVKR